MADRDRAAGVMAKKRPSLTVGVLLLLFGASAFCAHNERYRPQFHFSPRTNWTNDPCGLVYAFGKYHLFFQHNPFANRWGHMSWGHAVSTDLVHWSQLPVAIPEGKKVAIFTGSSVFDRKNTSGLCKSKQGCIVSIYTGETPKTAGTPERQTQNLAVSQDGRTWTKYADNPVLDLGRGDSRDPKVFWYAPAKRWIMVIVLANERKVSIFSSPNLKHWHHESDFGPQGATRGVWECPDLYSLPVPGHTGETRWILKVGLNPARVPGGSGEQYFIGRFDGTHFRNDNPSGDIHWLDYGRDSYCELTFNNEPKGQTPRMIGWMDNWDYAGVAPTLPWRGAMTLPKALSLAEVNGSLALVQKPVEQLRSLRGDAFEYEGANEADLNRKVAAWPHRSQSFELDATIRLGAAKQIVWRLLQGKNDETLVGYDALKQELFVDRSHCANAHFSKAFPSRTTAPLKIGNGRLRLHIFVDRSSIEVFAQGGRIAMTNLTFPTPSSTGLSLDSSDEIGSIHLKISKLRSIWK
ncbi:MAG TPA: glycoside hydrolase family 32 protein [Bryobacteraceae bacterium]